MSDDPQELVGQWVRLTHDEGPPTIGVLTSAHRATAPDGAPMWQWTLQCSQGTTFHGGGGPPITKLTSAHRGDVRRARRHLRDRRNHYTRLAAGYEGHSPELAREAAAANAALNHLDVQLAS